MTRIAEHARDAGQMDLFMLSVIDKAPPVDPDDFAAIAGQEIAKRALEIAAVCNHSLQFIGRCDEINTLMAAGKKIGAAQCFHYSDAAPTPLDLNVLVQPTSGVDLRCPPPAESSAEILARVAAARPRLDRWPREADEQALGLSDSDVASVWLVSRSIAALADCQGPMRRIHIAEALSYVWRKPRAAPEPTAPPPPAADDDARDIAACQARWVGTDEVIAVDPARLEYPRGDVDRSYSAQSLAEDGRVTSPFRFRGGEWVNTGSWGYRGARAFKCFRVVRLEDFDGPSATYSERRDPEWATARHNALGTYHAMRAKHGSRDVVLQGPPVIFVAGEPEQSALL